MRQQSGNHSASCGNVGSPPRREGLRRSPRPATSSTSAPSSTVARSPDLVYPSHARVPPGREPDQCAVNLSTWQQKLQSGEPHQSQVVWIATSQWLARILLTGRSDADLHDQLSGRPTLLRGVLDTRCAHAQTPQRTNHIESFGVSAQLRMDSVGQVHAGLSESRPTR